MQIVCIFILLHSVYDNSSLCISFSLVRARFSSFRRHFLEFSRQMQDERCSRRQRFVLLGKLSDTKLSSNNHLRDFGAVRVTGIHQDRFVFERSASHCFLLRNSFWLLLKYHLGRHVTGKRRNDAGNRTFLETTKPPSIQFSRQT